MSNLNEYINAANSYWGHHSKVVYMDPKKLERQKSNPSYPNYLTKYRMVIDNLTNAYFTLSKIKAEKGLKMLDFSSYKGNDFLIKNGKLVGDIEKAREFAMNYINKYSSNPLEDEDSIKKYELGLCIMHLITRLPEDCKYVEKSKEDDIKEKEETKTPKVSAPVDDKEEIKEDCSNKKPKDIATVIQPKKKQTFSLFELAKF